MFDIRGLSILNYEASLALLTWRSLCLVRYGDTIVACVTFFVTTGTIHPAIFTNLACYVDDGLYRILSRS